MWEREVDLERLERRVIRALWLSTKHDVDSDKPETEQAERQYRQQGELVPTWFRPSQERADSPRRSQPQNKRWKSANQQHDEEGQEADPVAQEQALKAYMVSLEPAPQAETQR